ncbi:hypothetical protein J8281_17725 [Aquimarina sp. U1-2]|nr:hypothetical protein [Aquimarina sp. U1-2]
MGLPRVSDVNTITGETAANIGNVVYNTTDNSIYRYDGTNWIIADDQFDDEVLLRTPIDVNNVPGDPNAGDETTVKQVIDAITPITSRAGRVFYPPSIEIDASVNSTADETIDLYAQYANQYDLTQTSTTINGTTVNYQTAKSPDAPNDIPIYGPNDLYYYVTFADTSVFNIISLSNSGILTYRIVGQPTNDNTIINVVFVVK